MNIVESNVNMDESNIVVGPQNINVGYVTWSDNIFGANLLYYKWYFSATFLEHEYPEYM